MDLKERWIEFKQQITSPKDSSEKIARAAALGAFLGTSATFGLAILFIYPVAKFFKLNIPVALAMSLLISNPWSTAFVWVGQMWLGFHLTGREIPQHLGDLIHGGIRMWGDYLWIYIIGAMVFGTLVGIGVYGLVFLSVSIYRKVRA